MRNMCKWFIVTILLFYVNGFLSKEWNSEDTANLEERIATVMECRRVPGMFLSVVKDDTVVLSKGYGYKDIEKNEPFTAQTPMSIQSTSKFMFTILTARMLTKYPQYSFDTTIKDLLGDEFELSDKTSEKEVTIRDILSMRHGIGDGEVFYDLVQNFFAWTKDDYIRQIKHYPVTDEVRRAYHYSSAGFAFLEKAFEILENKTTKQILHDELFEPLGMVNSNTIDEARFDDNYALGYQPGSNGTLIKVTGNFVSRSSGMIGGYGMASTADDLAKYLRFVLRGGVLEDGETVHVNRDLIEDALSPQMFYPNPYGGYTVADGYSMRPAAPFTSHTYAYGLASWHRYYRGFQLVQHTGSHFSDTLMTYHPDLKIGIYAGLNGPYERVSWTVETIVHEYILDILLDLPNYLNQTTVCAFPAPWGEPVDIPTFTAIPEDVASTLPLEKYTGVFGRAAYGCMNMTLNRTDDDTEVLQFSMSEARMFAYPKEGQAHEFWLKGVDDMYHLWYTGPYSIKFTESNGLINELIYQGLEFERM
ncbi:unnamed protein product, partial [Owenia fusiformis]